MNSGPARWIDGLRRSAADSPVLSWLRFAAAGRFPLGQALRGAWRAARFQVASGWDTGIFRHVAILDEYRLRPRRFAPDDVVVDVGAHVGSFAFHCHLLGARHILSFEPHPRTFELLARNCRRLPGARARPEAVFRSDPEAPRCRLPHSGLLSDREPGGNSGNGTVLFAGRLFDAETQTLAPGGSGDEVAVVPLDDILRAHPRVRLLKLDCEGSEFPILLTSRLLERVEEIVGEYHEVLESAYAALDPAAQVAGLQAYRIETLQRSLEGRGFTFRSEEARAHLGLFWASRAR